MRNKAAVYTHYTVCCTWQGETVQSEIKTKFAGAADDDDAECFGFIYAMFASNGHQFA